MALTTSLTFFTPSVTIIRALQKGSTADSSYIYLYKFLKINLGNIGLNYSS